MRAAREGYEHWNRGDIEAIVARIPEEFEFHIGRGVPDMPETLSGPEGVRELFRVWFSDAWQGNLHMDVRHLIEIDEDRVLALVIFRGRGEGSGVPVELEYAHGLTFRDGVNVRIDGFASWRRALRSVGMSEADLEAG
jgi:ketosteroid isomerase-like protein